MEKKKFKETKLGKLISEKLPEAVQLAGEFLPDNGVMGIIKNVISSSSLPDQDKKELLQAVREFELKELELYLQDSNSARDMQKAALAQEDRFSKRFIYYLASFWSLAAVTFIFATTFLNFPEQNRDIVHTALGFVLGTIVSTIIAYFFGSSKGSKDKDALLSSLTGKKNATT